MKLLIVDDSLIVRNVIERNAKHAQILEIHQAQNGAEAISLFIKHEPELVTMDLTMPELDGLACLKALQNCGRQVSILVISALNSHQTAMQAITRGACGFLTKPFTAAELSEAIHDLVQHAEENAEVTR